MEDRAMTGLRILSVVTLGSLHWTHAAGQGVVTGFVHVDLPGTGPQVKPDLIVLVDQDYRGDPLDLDIPPPDRESENTDRAPVGGQLSTMPRND